MDEKKKIDSILEKTAEKLTGLVDVNTVIGKPVLTASGAQVIPFTKVTMGYLSGGSDIGETKVIKADETVPFAGGSGAVVSLKPAGFILDDGNGCRYIHAGDDPVDNLIDKTSELLKSFQKKND